MKSRYFVTILVFVVAAAALGGIYLRLQQNSEETPEDSESATVDSARAAAQSTAASTAFATGVAVPVEGAVVERGTFVLWVSAEGQATAMRRAPLHAQVTGPVIEVPVREGAWVSAGDVIARIDPVEYEISRKEAQGALEQAEASYQDLTLGDETIDDPEVLAVRQAQARIRSGLAGAEARLEQAKYNLEKTVIRAPYSGRLANLVVDVGTRLGVNDSVATVVDVSSIDVDVQVLESEIAALDVGRDATVTFVALPGEQFRGRGRDRESGGGPGEPRGESHRPPPESRCPNPAGDARRGAHRGPSVRGSRLRAEGGDRRAEPQGSGVRIRA